MKFALIIIESGRSRDSIATDRAAHNSKLTAWMNEQGERGVLLGGEAFETEDTGPVTVRFASDGTATATEEPFAAGEETLGGYLLIEAADRNEAVRIAESFPTGETVEVRPVLSAE